MRLSNDFTLRSIQYVAVKCKRNREFYHNSDVSFYDRLCIKTYVRSMSVAILLVWIVRHTALTRKVDVRF